MSQRIAAAAGRSSAPALRTLPSSLAWVPSAHCRPPRNRRQWRQCRAAEWDDAGEWQRAAGGGGGGGGARQSAFALLPDDALHASAELQELCRLQLQLLTAALKLSLQAVLSSSVLGSVSDSLDDEMLRQQLLLETACLRASAYCRAPASLQTGALQLQLVATSDESGSGGSGIGGSVSSAQAAQRFLFLGQDGAGGGSLHEQEQWILEQPVIVLPDSGGLVLPLAHNGFLVGLLVVERCLEEGETLAATSTSAAAGPGAGAAAAGGGSGSASSSSSSCNGASSSAGSAAADSSAASNGSAAAMPQPPACLLFRSAELQLLKQTAAICSLAMAMDMRAALERVGAAVRQRQASALVQEAKKPLSMMRTLGTMLLPRLQPGEPDRDFAQGILEQGTRLSEVVSQLQAALHPAASSVVVPPALLAGGGSNGSAASQLGGRQQQALPGNIISGGGSIISESGSNQLPARPALPSSSIGSDYQWSAATSGEATIDMSIDEQSQAQLSTHQPAAMGGSSSSSSSALASSGSSSSAGAPLRSAVPFSGSPSGSRASADLLNVLMPLLASASNLAAVSGIAFVMAEHSSSGGSGGSGSGTPTAVAPQQLALPAAEVAVGPGTLKRMLSQLIDGIIACAARGDVVQASVQPRQWQGRPGVAIMLCCAYGLNHSSGSGAAVAAADLRRPPLQPEFAFLHTTAAEAGGMFEVHTDATPDVAHLNSSALAATLWLPTVPVRKAAWN
ncbi:hypothetical protein C2E21_4621 [Chlorella sorokiniana]|uniref:Uncharacterized protein n=1 Tax=Chlorella sorokiniana TaxID=3076 RepID=A0A2P6TRF8_CHLSO|nr:hypothetical protein C2E21_4621 [Chlorella sorokiniana]|eukprot:PRW56641.1 hypothetical protein C2E21_4621 [Chlorella sorokiniana]